ncbi:hypothetical protein QJQ45_016571, partial [Haematococcus lacustris]
GGTMSTGLSAGPPPIPPSGPGALIAAAAGLLGAAQHPSSETARPAADPVRAASAYGALTEKDIKERALKERQEKRATLVVAVVRKFIHAFYSGRQQMIDAARAADAARRAKAGKKGGRRAKKKGADKADAKSVKDKKKAKKTPVQESWSTFLVDMDERINKQKRVFLEDLYRGVAKLDPLEQGQLAALLSTTNKKILPVDTLNINQLNIKAAVTAASSALSLSADRSATPGAGLQLLADRGTSPEQMLQHGFSEADLLRAGVPRHQVVQVSQHDVRKLRCDQPVFVFFGESHAAAMQVNILCLSAQDAGLQVPELLTSPTATGLASRLREGVRGVAELRKAGYSAAQVQAAGAGDAWSLHRAGYCLAELEEAQVPARDLHRVGLLQPGSGDPAFLGASLRAVMRDTEATQIPTYFSAGPHRRCLHGAGAHMAQPGSYRTGALLECGEAGVFRDLTATTARPNYAAGVREVAEFKPHVATGTSAVMRHGGGCVNALDFASCGDMSQHQ